MWGRRSLTRQALRSAPAPSHWKSQPVGAGTCPGRAAAAAAPTTAPHSPRALPLGVRVYGSGPPLPFSFCLCRTPGTLEGPRVTHGTQRSAHAAPGPWWLSVLMPGSRGLPGASGPFGPAQLRLQRLRQGEGWGTLGLPLPAAALAEPLSSASWRRQPLSTSCVQLPGPQGRSWWGVGRCSPGQPWRQRPEVGGSAGPQTSSGKGRDRPLWERGGRHLPAAGTHPGTPATPPPPLRFSHALSWHRGPGRAGTCPPDCRKVGAASLWARGQGPLQVETQPEKGGQVASLAEQLQDMRPCQPGLARHPQPRGQRAQVGGGGGGPFPLFLELGPGTEATAQPPSGPQCPPLNAGIRKFVGPWPGWPSWLGIARQSQRWPV